MSLLPKKNNYPTILFFGSGPVAAKSLSLLLDSFNIEAIITKPATFGMMQDVAPGVLVLPVSSKLELDDLVQSTPFKSHLGVLIDFGIIVSSKTIEHFPLGIINSHFSVLPEWRGPDPITFSILSGQEKTGVSLMLLVEGMDEGPLLAYSETAVGSETTTPELTDTLIVISDGLLKHTLPAYLDGKIKAISQQDAAVLAKRIFTPTYSRKLTKADGLIDWHKPADQLAREIRAFIEWPKSYTTISEHDVVITKAYSSSEVPKGPVGKFTYSKTLKELLVVCKTGILHVQKLKPAGKKEMSAESFANGYKQWLSD